MGALSPVIVLTQAVLTLSLLRLQGAVALT